MFFTPSEGQSPSSGWAGNNMNNNNTTINAGNAAAATTTTAANTATASAMWESLGQFQFNMTPSRDNAAPTSTTPSRDFFVPQALDFGSSDDNNMANFLSSLVEAARTPVRGDSPTNDDAAVGSKLYAPTPTAQQQQQLEQPTKKSSPIPPKPMDVSALQSTEDYIQRLVSLARSTSAPIHFRYPVQDGTAVRVFDISGATMRRYGLYHGQRIRKPYGEHCAVTGTIIGVGADNALWWHRDGDSAAIRLALLPDHVTKYGIPKVVGAAIVREADE
eukprot:PhM_4_TR3827/c0_g1_i1/m.43817